MWTQPPGLVLLLSRSHPAPLTWHMLKSLPRSTEPQSPSPAQLPNHKSPRASRISWKGWLQPDPRVSASSVPQPGRLKALGSSQGLRSAHALLRVAVHLTALAWPWPTFPQLSWWLQHAVSANCPECLPPPDTASRGCGRCPASCFPTPEPAPVPGIPQESSEGECKHEYISGVQHSGLL